MLTNIFHIIFLALIFVGKISNAEAKHHSRLRRKLKALQHHHNGQEKVQNDQNGKEISRRLLPEILGANVFRFTKVVPKTDDDDDKKKGLTKLQISNIISLCNDADYNGLPQKDCMDRELAKMETEANAANAAALDINYANRLNEYP